MFKIISKHTLRNFKYILFFLLLSSSVLAVNLTNENTSNYHFDSMGRMVNDRPAPEELVKQYCGQVQVKGVFLIIIGALMWLLEPMVKKIIDKINKPVKTESLMFIYKWLGLGLLFLGSYATIRLVMI